ncbi:MAG: hypothetical protein JSR39_01655 [Verrucomicrobia bacterium]|nr:hypothetical protein [Verrucomicrobiota bacterium]
MAASLSNQTHQPLWNMAGVSTYLPGIDGQPTYSRTYEHVGPDDPRKKIAEQCRGGADHYKVHGEAYSYTPSELRDGRAFGTAAGEHPGGGFFLTVHTFDSEDLNRYNNCLKYALLNFADPIEMRFGELIGTQDALGEAYFFNEVVKRYFRNISSPDQPKDGDLAVYEVPNRAAQHIRQIGTIAHAGIFRESKPNWNSPSGGTIESKWGWLASHHVFQHDLFWTPPYYGDVVKFYRLREKA